MNHIWYSSTNDKRSPDAIHQILAFGTLDDINALKKTVGEKEIRSLFMKYPKKIYTSSLLNFIKNFILRIPAPIDEQKYLKYTPRHT